MSPNYTEFLSRLIFIALGYDYDESWTPPADNYGDSPNPHKHKWHMSLQMHCSDTASRRCHLAVANQLVDYSFTTLRHRHRQTVVILKIGKQYNYH